MAKSQGIKIEHQIIDLLCKARRNEITTDEYKTLIRIYKTPEQLWTEKHGRMAEAKAKRMGAVK